MDDKTPRQQLAINTLSNLSVVGFALGLYEGRVGPFFLAALAYVLAYMLARRSQA